MRFDTVDTVTDEIAMLSRSLLSELTKDSSIYEVVKCLLPRGTLDVEKLSQETDLCYHWPCFAYLPL